MSSICCLSLSLSLSVQINLMPLLFAKWFTTIKFSVILCAPKNWFRTVWRRRRRGLASSCFVLDSSLRAFPKTFQIYLLGTFSNVCTTLNWLPSTSSSFKWHSIHLIEFSFRHFVCSLFFNKVLFYLSHFIFILSHFNFPDG